MYVSMCIARTRLVELYSCDTITLTNPYILRSPSFRIVQSLARPAIQETSFKRRSKSIHKAKPVLKIYTINKPKGIDKEGNYRNRNAKKKERIDMVTQGKDSVRNSAHTVT